MIGTALGGKYKIARCPYTLVDGLFNYNEREIQEAEADAKLMAASPLLLKEMLRYLPILEWIESDAVEWEIATKGTGIATLNGYRNAIEKATK